MGIADWDTTLPDGVNTALSEHDNYIREIKEDIVAWYAVEHNSNGGHKIPYLTRGDRIAYAYAVAGTIVFDSDDGYAYRYSGTAWVRIYPKGREATYTADATPSVADYDVLLMTSVVSVTDFDDGVQGQVIMVLASAAVTITDSAAIHLNGTANFVMAAGDTLTLKLFADGIWHEQGRMVRA